MKKKIAMLLTVSVVFILAGCQDWREQNENYSILYVYTNCITSIFIGCVSIRIFNRFSKVIQKKTLATM